MVRASNPKLMSRVLEAVIHLGETKGSSVRDILQLVKKGSNGPNRNLTMQVQRALKHAVTAGILKHRNGRYKNAIALAPISQTTKRRRSDDDYKVVEDLPDVDESQNIGVDPFGSVQDRRRRKRRGSRRRRGSRKRRGSRRRGRRRNVNEEYEDIGPIDRRKTTVKLRDHDDENTEHRNQKNRNSDKYSDISGSEHDCRHRSRRSKPEHSNTSRRSNSRPRPKEEICEKNNRRSSSRNRSQPRTTQPPVEDSDNHNAMDCEDDVHDMGHHGQDIDNCETKNCGSESSLN